MSDSTLRFDVPDQALLDRLAVEPLPAGLRASAAQPSFHRDIYFDTPDAVLQQRGVTCRFRITVDDRRFLTVTMRVAVGDGSLVEWRRYEALVSELEATDALLGASKPARRLRGLIDPRHLGVRVELQTQRRTRTARVGLWPVDRFEIHCDAVSVRSGSLTRTFHELVIRKLMAGGPDLDDVRDAFRAGYGLQPVLMLRFQRAEELLDSLERVPPGPPPETALEVALLAVAGGQLALEATDGELRVPRASGDEAAARRLAADLGLDAGGLRRLGTVPTGPEVPRLDVWLASLDEPGGPATGELHWLPVSDALALAGQPALRDAGTLAALAMFASDDARDGPSAPPEHGGDPSRPLRVIEVGPAATAPSQFLNAEISWLEFNRRLIDLADDPATPLLAKLRFLAILASNLDEFFMVRVGSLRQALAEGASDAGDDGLGVREQLNAIAAQVHGLLARQQRCLAEVCLPALAEHDIRILRWGELAKGDQQALSRSFHDQVSPLLTPHAITRAPGHPFPHIANLRLALGLMVRDEPNGRIRFGSLILPEVLPRFVQLSSRRHFVPLEDVVRAHLHELYPRKTVEAAHCFRVTRAGDLALDEQSVDDLLHAVEEEVKRRPFAGVVRLEVDRAMSGALRELLQRELRMVAAGRAGLPGRDGIYEVDGLLDLGALKEIAALDVPELDYPRVGAVSPIPSERSVFEVLRDGDLLVHHPYDAFDGSVLRLFTDAAADPDVLALKLTLYRAGARSPVVDALIQAAQAGKEVDVFVELKARFDEERNVDWVRKLERAGVHVVYGYVRLKTHAKVALVVRREGDAVRRYVHVGTGNYNAATARLYTDLGLLSADDTLGAELADFFNELTGSSEPPQQPGRRLVVAPTFMLQRFLDLIERETAHAQAQRGGQIRVKMNGLADRKIIKALYQASQAGVQIDLVVRGICTLRPGVPGLSERIRVVSVMGRFLEHARICHFHNGGDDEYYVGSADWRPRNLRRRVEVVAAVTDERARARLDRILATELADASAWELGADGWYRRRGPGPGSAAQAAFLADLGELEAGLATR